MSTENQPWKIFSVNECDWHVARTSEEAVSDYEALTGVKCDDPDEIYEVSETAMRTLPFEHENDDFSITQITFREELDRRIKAGLSKPEHFASTEC